jgi:hypothetical protein
MELERLSGAALTLSVRELVEQRCGRRLAALQHTALVQHDWITDGFDICDKASQLGSLLQKSRSGLLTC